MKNRLLKRRFTTRISFIKLVFLVSILGLVATFVFVVTRPNFALAMGKYAPVNEATLFKNHTISYPIFHDPKLDAIVRSYVTSQIDAFENRPGNKGNSRSHLTINYVLPQVGQRTVSIVFTAQEKRLGQPATSKTQLLTVDLVQKRQLSFGDVLQESPTARTALAKLLYRYFKRHPGLNLSLEEQVGLLELSLSDIKDFSFQNEALVIYLDPRQPASTTTPVPIAISKSLLAGVLREPYLADVGHRVGAKPTAAYHITESPSSGANPAEKMLALTFDDGPSHLTPQLLNTLDKYDAKATFFVLGHSVGGHAAVLQRMLKEGSEIGNHSWNHPSFALLSPAELDFQITETQKAIQATTGGYLPRLVRPPYGISSPAVQEYLAARGYTEALWNIDTNDWQDRRSEAIYQHIMANAHDGGIVLLHDIYPSSVEAAARAIRDLKTQGYQLVTVSELLRY